MTSDQRKILDASLRAFVKENTFSICEMGAMKDALSVLCRHNALTSAQIEHLEKMLECHTEGE